MRKGVKQNINQKKEVLTLTNILCCIHFVNEIKVFIKLLCEYVMFIRVSLPLDILTSLSIFSCIHFVKIFGFYKICCVNTYTQ